MRGRADAAAAVMRSRGDAQLDILEALCGIEEARVTLAQAVMRLEDRSGPRFSG